MKNPIPGLILPGILLLGSVSSHSLQGGSLPGDDEQPHASAFPRVSECRAVGLVSPFDCPPCLESVVGELQRLVSNKYWRGKIMLFVSGDSVSASQFIRHLKRRFALAYPIIPLDSAAGAALGGMNGNPTPVVILFGRAHVLERVIHVRPEILLSFSLLVDSLRTAGSSG